MIIVKSSGEVLQKIYILQKCNHDLKIQKHWLKRGRVWVFAGDESKKKKFQLQKANAKDEAL